MFTARQLRDWINDLHENDLDAEVRVVFQGYEKSSFNLPGKFVEGPIGIATSEGPGFGISITCEEPRPS